MKKQLLALTLSFFSVFSALNSGILDSYKTSLLEQNKIGLGAIPNFPEEALWVKDSVKELSLKHGIKEPLVFYCPLLRNAISQSWPPAIFIGGELLKYLTKEEVVGILAHELGHIKNNDSPKLIIMQYIPLFFNLLILFLFFFFVFRRFKTFSGRKKVLSMVVFYLCLITNSQVSQIIYAKLMKNIEYNADFAGASVLENPNDMLSGLSKISTYHETSGFADLFMIHPSVQARRSYLEKSFKL